MRGVELIGAAAATITTLCWLPQAVNIVRTRETKGISLLSYGAFASGIVLWLIYGLLIESWPLIGANVVTLAIVCIIIALKLHHGRHEIGP